MYFRQLIDSKNKMKTLLLLRHADTEELYSGQKDFDRELTTQGISDAIYKGIILKEKKLIFDLILSSTAKRTKKTSELVAEQVGYTIRNVEYKEEIYLASTRTMLSEINLINDKYKTVLMVSHNPGTEYIAEYLTGESIGALPTSGAMHIQFESNSWQEVSEGTGSLKWTDFTQS